MSSDPDPPDDAHLDTHGHNPRQAVIAEANRRVRDREQVLAETEAAMARARDALEDARAARRRLGD